MSIYWKDYQGQDESFWEHEWGKHGTCISTFSPSCYTSYIPTQEVVEYFEKTLQLFSVLDTYTFLKDAGIVPSTTKTYSYAEIRKALVRDRHVNATIECTGSNRTELDEVYYYYNVYGSAQDGLYIPAEPGKYLSLSRRPPVPRGSVCVLVMTILAFISMDDSFTDGWS